MVPERKNDDTGRVLYLHLIEDAGPVAFNGPLAQVEQATNLLRGVLAADQPDDLLFPVGEKRFPGLLLAVKLTPYDHRRQPGGGMLAIKDAAFMDGEDRL